MDAGHLSANMGPVPTKNMQTSLPLPFFRSDHLNLKDAQCAENIDERKISYRVWGPRTSKRCVLGAQKFNFLQKWPHLQGRSELI